MAPEVGCGSRARPILVELEGHSTVRSARLNGTGTVLAVLGKGPSSRESRARLVLAALEAEGAQAEELNGPLREQALKSYAEGEEWYGAAETDHLSEREAGLVARRLVRRVKTAIALADGQAAALEAALAAVFHRRLASGFDRLEETGDERRATELLQAARTSLDESGLRALRSAIAKGCRPQPNEA